MQDGPPTTTRNLSTGIDPATFTQQADQVSEDQLGLDKGQRRDVQRRLTALGFDARVTGKFDEATRTVIRRWQEKRVAVFSRDKRGTRLRGDHAQQEPRAR